MYLHIWILLVTVACAFGRPDSQQLPDNGIRRDRHLHRISKRDIGETQEIFNSEEKSANYWITKAQFTLSEQLAKQPKLGKARNVILFLGDGMSIPTLAAARVYLGQGAGKSGEEGQLTFEKFPYTGLSKTYCVDRQVADSACSATAYLCGVKANEGTIGVTAAVPLGKCNLMQDSSTHVYSIARWSQQQQKRTGVVTTTRITHASPAGLYAHSAHRDWESDSDVVKAGLNPNDCPDIATQLIHGETGKNLNVIFGGGRGEFIPTTEIDEEGETGLRSDGQNLIEQWKQQKTGSNYHYVFDRFGLLDVPDTVDHVLGLFEKDHMKYNLDRDPLAKPSLSEMTEKSIRILSNSEKGYFLFVEGGRIDHAHHDTLAQKALNETIEFDKAVQKALEMTNPEDTLIVVTSDHAHTMSLSGYALRGNDILGTAGLGEDNMPYSTLSYANGPGYRVAKDGRRHDLSTDDLHNKEYKFPSLVPTAIETHGGDDVAIFANGPWAHLFTGVIEQNVIPHIMAYASCVGNGITVCDEIRFKK